MATTWYDNVRDGNVYTSNNDPLGLGSFYRNPGSEWFNTRPGNTMYLDWVQGAESVTTLMDGTTFGITYKDANTYEMWFSIADVNHQYTTSAGTPCDAIWYGGLPSSPSIPHDPLFHLGTITKIGFALADGYWNDTMDLPGQQVIWIQEGIAVSEQGTITHPYSYAYGGNELVWSTWGDQFGTNVLWVDELSSDNNAGIEYPGEEGESGGGGADPSDGDYNFDSDEVGFTPLPGLQIIDFGMCHMYTPDTNQMQGISQWLWSTNYTENVAKNWASPFENILTLAVVPIVLTGSLSTFNIGGVESNLEVYAYDTEYKKIQWKPMDMERAFGSFLDYNGTYQIWLPYIGYRPLKPDDILKTILEIEYHVDLVTGAAVCEICATSTDKTLKSYGKQKLLYSYNTNIFYCSPISGSNYINMYNQQTNAVNSGNMGVLGNIIGGIGNLLTGNVGGVVGNVMSGITGATQAKQQYDSAKPDYGRTGSFGGNNGWLGGRLPYIIKTLPCTQIPKHYSDYNGYPIQGYYQLNTLTGYTEVASVNIDIDCTEEEKQEIAQLLSSGVYL